MCGGIAIDTSTSKKSYMVCDGKEMKYLFLHFLFNLATKNIRSNISTTTTPLLRGEFLEKISIVQK